MSVVIPTRFRPELVLRAVRSALVQSAAPLEIIVVVDGPDPTTEVALAGLRESTVKVLVLPENSGPSLARNAGVVLAKGTWIAFLDDDDEWAPEKLAAQLEVARASRTRWPIVTCRVIARTPRGDHIWPNRPPGNDEHISDFLMDRRSLLGRPGFVGTPTLLAPRSLLLALPMPVEEDHEDWSWLLKALAVPETELLFVWRPLCLIHIEPHRHSRSRRDNWLVSFDWGNRHVAEITKRAYAAFMLTKVAGKARRQGCWLAFWKILQAVRKHGHPRFVHYVLFAGTWFAPSRSHRFLQLLSFSSRR